MIPGMSHNADKQHNEAVCPPPWQHLPATIGITANEDASAYATESFEAATAQKALQIVKQTAFAGTDP
jgi:hypothetical protein